MSPYLLELTDEQRADLSRLVTRLVDCSTRAAALACSPCDSATYEGSIAELTGAEAALVAVGLVVYDRT